MIAVEEQNSLEAQTDAFEMTYDGLDRLISEITPQVTAAANEQIQFNNATPNLTYDGNRNLTSQTDASGTTTYTWDARNRLVAINGPSVTASFEYDALGRRVSKTIIDVTTEYQYDGNDIISEIGGGSIGVTYLRSLIIDEPLIRQGNSNEYYHVDALGSVMGLSDDAGVVQTTYRYDPFGNTMFTGTSSNPFQYTGRENDGTGLYYYRARYYSPAFQRFISEDPIGLLGSDTNLYQYVFNNPTNFIDPNGLCVPLTPDVVLDVGFLVYDLTRLAIDGRKGLEENLAALTGDLIGACTPGLTGLGLGVRAIKGGNKFLLHPRVLDQLKDPRLGQLAGKLSAKDLSRLVENPNARRFFDVKSGNINVIQEVEGKLLRITMPRDTFKIISVGPIRANQIQNNISSGHLVPLR